MKTHQKIAKEEKKMNLIAAEIHEVRKNAATGDIEDGDISIKLRSKKTKKDEDNNEEEHPVTNKKFKVENI